MKTVRLFIAATIVLLSPCLRAEDVLPVEGFGAWLVSWDEVDSGSELDCFSEVNPFAYALSKDFVPTLVHPELLKKSLARRRKGVLFMPVVVNDVFADGKLQTLKSDRALTAILSNPKRMSKHIKQLVEIARDFDGLEVDYERIPAKLWDQFADFVAKLGGALHAEGKKLYVDLEPAFVHRGDLGYRYGARLAESVDGIKLMAYYEKGGPSLKPVAGNSLSWVIDTARRALENIPREKLVIALSLAGTEWAAPLPGVSYWNSKRFHYGKVMELLSKSGAEVQWDAAAACPFFIVSGDEGERRMWFEDERSLGEKIRALRGLGIGKIGFWYWGRRHPDVKSLGLCQN